MTTCLRNGAGTPSGPAHKWYSSQSPALIQEKK